MDISIVIPVYGCPTAIPELHKRLVETLDNMQVSYEIIMVDDCDEMGSWDYIQKAALSDKRVKAIRLTRNYGQGQAITAGVNRATGDWIVTMDCDLQDAPENIPLLYERAKQGFDVVFVRRRDRKDSFLTKVLSMLYHKLFSYLSELPFDYELGTFLIASKRAANCYRESKVRGRDFTMFLVWTHYRSDSIELEHEERFAGETSYTFIKKWRYAVAVMTAYSNRILYIPIKFGLFVSGVSIGYIILVLISYYCFDGNPVGWSTIAASIFFFGGLILSTLGILGVYIGNIFEVCKDRPFYLVQEEININDNN